MGVWVGGKAEQIKQILKSSWQLNKTAPKAVCHGLVFKRWPPLSVPGFVHVLVSQRFHLPPRRSHRCLCNYYWHKEEEATMNPQTLQKWFNPVDSLYLSIHLPVWWALLFLSYFSAKKERKKRRVLWAQLITTAITLPEFTVTYHLNYAKKSPCLTPAGAEYSEFHSINTSL